MNQPASFTVKIVSTYSYKVHIPIYSAPSETLPVIFSVLEWSDTGCSTSKIYNELTDQYDVTCSCDHLTSFAVLMVRIQKPKLIKSIRSSDFHILQAVTSDTGSDVYKAEDITTQVLQYLSIICLVLTLLAILPNKLDIF